MNVLLPLYIDPGTGSMLFSVLLGLSATLYFVGKTAFIKLKFLIGGKKNGAQVTNSNAGIVLFCEGAQYINVFLPILQTCENRKIPITYYTGAEQDPALHASYTYIKSEYIGQGNTAIARLNFLQADICLMTTPGLDVYQLKRSKGVKHYSHILHAPSDATMYRLFGLDYFDSVLLTGDYQKKDIRVLEHLRHIPEKELVTVGCPYLDVLQQKIEALKQHKAVAHETKNKAQNLTVLVSPSWGKSALLSRYGEKLLDPLVKTGFRIIVRPHPQSKKSEAALLEGLEKRYKDAANIEWNYESDNINALSRADIMISDFSGIIFDYAFLREKPFLYINEDIDIRPYDAGDLAETEPPIEAWQFSVLPTIGKKLSEADFTDIGTVISDCINNADYKAGQKKAKETAWMYRGQSGERIADFLIQKQHKIREQTEKYSGTKNSRPNDR